MPANPHTPEQTEAEEEVIDYLANGNEAEGIIMLDRLLRAEYMRGYNDGYQDGYGDGTEDGHRTGYEKGSRK